MHPYLCSQNVQTLCPYGKTRQIRGACESFPVCELAPGAGFHVTSGKQTQRLRRLLLHYPEAGSMLCEAVAFDLHHIPQWAMPAASRHLAHIVRPLQDSCVLSIEKQNPPVFSLADCFDQVTGTAQFDPPIE